MPRRTSVEEYLSRCTECVVRSLVSSRQIRHSKHFPPALCATRAGGEGYRRNALRPDTFRTPESAVPVTPPLPKAAAQRRGATRSSQSEHGERG